MTPAQLIGLMEFERPREAESEGTESDWAMLAALPMGG